MKINLFAPLALALALALAGCSKKDDSASEQARLEVRLVAGPGDFQQVVLDVRQVEVHLTDEHDPNGWQLLPFQAQAIDILNYVNGRSALLVSTDFAPGDLKEIRLLLGPDSYVIGRDGQRYDLKTPSGQSSGVKLKLDKATLRARENFQLVLDFNVAKSIVERGNWQPGNDKKERYLLKPVIRVLAQELRATLIGTATPAAARPQVLAIRQSITLADTFSTAADANSGQFRFDNLPSGTYRVELFPTTTAPAGQAAYRVETRSGVVLINEQVTDLRSIQLN